MAEQASFTRIDTPQGTEFHIKPAPWVGGWASIQGGGCAHALALLAVYFSAAAVLWAMTLGNGLVVAAYSAPFWVPGALMLANQRRKNIAAAGPRDPLTLVVNPQGITKGARHYAKSDIAKLIWRHPAEKGGYSVETVAYSSGGLGDVGADIGRRVGMKAALRAANTSFAVLIRTKSSSEFEVLVPGLTPGVAEALHQDIMEAMN